MTKIYCENHRRIVFVYPDPPNENDEFIQTSCGCRVTLEEVREKKVNSVNHTRYFLPNGTELKTYDTKFPKKYFKSENDDIVKTVKLKYCGKSCESGRVEFIVPKELVGKKLIISYIIKN